MKDSKFYLKPQCFRRGSNTLVFIAKEFLCGSKKASYWLGVNSELRLKNSLNYTGTSNEYDRCEQFQISKALFEAFKIESLNNYAKYSAKKRTTV